MEDNESLDKGAELQFLIKNKNHIFYLKIPLMLLFLRIVFFFLYKTNIVLTYI